MGTALQDDDLLESLRKRIATRERRIKDLQVVISEHREQLRDAYRKLEIAQDRKEFDPLKAFIKVKSSDRGWNAASIMSFVEWAIGHGLTPSHIEQASKPKPNLPEPPNSPTRKRLEVNL